MSTSAAPTPLAHADAARLAPVLAFREVFSQPGFRAWDAQRKPHPGAPEVDEFVAALRHASVLRDFDWPEWMRERGDQYVRAESLERADFETIACLLSALVRKEQFVEGQLADLIESGWMSAALDRLAVLAQQDASRAGPTGEA